MARPLRIEYPGALYHVTSRGNAGSDIFLDDGDRRIFLKLLGLVVERFNWRCHAYCLMSNHYHLLVETVEANLSRGMRQLNGIYTQKVNWKHGRVGHLFQGRYKAIIVDRDEYFLEVARYLMLNPVRAGLVERPEDYVWSSYRAILGRQKVPEFLTIEDLLGRMDLNRERARGLFAEFVGAGIKAERSPWENLKGQICLGGESFLERLWKQVKERRADLREIPRKQKDLVRPGLPRLFEDFLRRPDKEERNLAIYRAHVEMGYKLQEIADFLELHYSSVSRIVTQVHRRMLKFKT